MQLTFPVIALGQGANVEGYANIKDLQTCYKKAVVDGTIQAYEYIDAELRYFHTENIRTVKTWMPWHHVLVLEFKKFAEVEFDLTFVRQVTLEEAQEMTAQRLRRLMPGIGFDRRRANLIKKTQSFNEFFDIIGFTSRNGGTAARF